MPSRTARTCRLLGAVTLSALTLLALAGPAHAADEITIDHVESSDGKVSMILSVDGVPSGTVDPSSVVVEVDGRLGHEGEHTATDRQRDRRAAGTGRVTLRAGWVDVEGDPCGLAVDVHAALRARGHAEPIRACGPGCAARRVPAA